MKLRILTLLCCMSFTLMASAQASGGQIRRKKSNTSSTTKKITNERINGNRSTVKINKLEQKQNVQVAHNKEDNQETFENKKEKESLDSIKKEDEEKKRIICSIIDNMVYVEGGDFIMGVNSEDEKEKNSYKGALKYSKPTHKVTLSNFWIGKFEITQEQWMFIMGSNPSHFYGLTLPVETVKWSECVTFIEKLNKITGKKFRLPTEAEWEFAARGGKNSYTRYSGGNSLDEYAWYKGNSDQRTHPIGTKRPNRLGLYDMSGNVCEWCQDNWSKYKKKSQKNPVVMLPKESSRVIKGGSYCFPPFECLVSFHMGAPGNLPFFYTGFRLAMSDE